MQILTSCSEEKADQFKSKGKKFVLVASATSILGFEVVKFLLLRKYSVIALCAPVGKRYEKLKGFGVSFLHSSYGTDGTNQYMHVYIHAEQFQQSICKEMQKFGVGTLVIPPMYNEFSLKELQALLSAAKEAKVEKIISVCPIYSTQTRSEDVR